MQCLACGAAMHLVQVVRDDGMPVPRYEHRTFTCSACGDVERRLVFTRNTGQSHSESVPMHTTPPILPAAVVQNQRATASGILRRLVTRLRGGQDSASRVAESVSSFTAESSTSASRPVEPASSLAAPPGSASLAAKPMSFLTPTGSVAPAEPESAPAAAHPSLPSEADKHLEEIEALLRRTIERNRRPTRTPAELAGSAPGHSAPLTSVSSEPDNEDQEPEALPNSAIEMDRGPKRPSEAQTSLAEATSATAAELASATEAKSSLPNRFAQIHYDRHKAAYVAKDTTSGLRILRHEDRARLQAMCERIGWQVVDAGEPSADD